jgi:hypothetical protein
MATLVITVVVPDSVNMVTDQLQGVGTITSDPNAQDRVARYIEGVATGAFGLSTFTTAVS